MLGIIAFASAVAALLFNNTLFAIVILLGAFVVALHAEKHPSRRRFKLTRMGIAIDDRLYPYDTLDSFFVRQDGRHKFPLLLVRSKKLLMPHIVIPVSGVSGAAVRQFLIEHLKEEEQHEPIAHHLAEFFEF